MRIRTVFTVVALAIAGVLAPAPAMAAPPGDVPCNTYSILGLRGSGEKRESISSFAGSPALGSFATAVKSSLGTKKVAIINVWYEAMAVPGTDPSKTKEVRPVDYVKYAKSASNGIVNLRSMIASRRSACPNERVIVAGYSQGAWAAHATLNALADRNGVVKGVYAAALIADPLYRHGMGKSMGTAKSSGAAGNRVSAGFAKLLRDSADGVPYFAQLFTPGFTATKVGLFQLCDAHDVVCDTMAWAGAKVSFAAGLKIHLSYSERNGSLIGPRVTPMGLAVAKLVKK